MIPTTNFRRNFHSHNDSDNSYVNNSTNFTKVDNHAVQKNPRGLEILSRKAVLTALYNSSERGSAAACLQGTRQDVLERVYTWADSRSDSTVCLVYGPLGSGKTTLATTLAEKYDKENRSAGTFFFSGDPSHDPERRSLDRIIPTIAYQNSISHPIIREKVIQVLNSDPTILSKSLETQFHSLLVGPFRRRRFSRPFTRSFLKVWAALSVAQVFFEVWITLIFGIIFPPSNDCREAICFIFMVASAVAALPTIKMAIQTHLEAFLYPPPMIVVIDAINECHGPLQTFIKILADKYRESPPPIRFIVTSRPEEEVLGEFRCHSKRVYSLDLADFTAHQDIELFFEEEFNILRTKHLVFYRGLGKLEDWPSPQDFDLLVRRSEGLFVYAWSLVKFVGDCNHGGDLQSKLRRALYQHDGLDIFFRRVLRDAPEFYNPEFHRLLGAICFLYDELPLGSLVLLLRLHSAADARRLLRGCRSIVQIPQADHENFTFCHSSLRHFLIDRNRSHNFTFDRNNYWIDPKKQHLSLFYDCVELIVAERQNGSINIKPDRVNYFELSTRYAWENWHRHLFDVQLTCQGIIELTRAYFGERYESLFLNFLDHLGDGTSWAFGCQSITWQGLEHQLLSIDDADTVLSGRIQRIRKSLETIRFHAMFPGAHKLDIKDCGVNEIWALDCLVEDTYNIGVDIEAEAETDELDPGKEILSKANTLVAKKKGVNVGSESGNPQGNHPPEPEHQLETPLIRKSLIIYTSVDVAPKTLKMPTDIIFTLTPPTTDPDKPWPTIVWKTLHFEQTTTTENELFWSSRSGFCVVEELDDGTLQPGDLHAVVKPGYAAILQDLHDGRRMFEQLPLPFKTSTIAVSNMTGSRLRLALCSIDPTNEVDVFFPVVDLDSVVSFGKHVFACKPPVMLQAYAVSGYQDHQLIDPNQLHCPLFLKASSSAPQAIDLSRLSNQLMKFRLYSDDTGKVILEMISLSFQESYTMAMSRH